MSRDDDRVEQIRAGRIDTPKLQANELYIPTNKTFTRIAFLKGLGTFLIGAAMLCLVIIAWRLLDANRELRLEQACRFDISTEVNSIADNIDSLTAEIFVEAIRKPSRPGHPNPEVVRLGQELDHQVRALHPAIKAREAATESCKEKP